MGEALFDNALAAAAGRPPFAKLLGEQLFNQASPFALLGGIRTDAGRIDLKLYGLFPIVTAARALAIRHGIRRRSTKGRLEGLIERGLGSPDEIAELIAAHGLFVGLMLEQQARDLETGVRVSNRVDISPLSRARQAGLKAALKATQAVPDMVRTLMFG